MVQFNSQLPPFESIDVTKRRAMLTYLKSNGEETRVPNIIHVDEIPERAGIFCQKVLNPILRGTQATIVPILNGALFFAYDLIREIDEASEVEIMSVTARSYGRSRKSGEVFVSQDTIIPEKIKNRSLIIVDDILDTGKTVAEVIRRVEEYEPVRIITVFMIRKMIASQPLVCPDYWLFEVRGASFVAGYGMDLKEKHRQLKYVFDANRDLYDKKGYPLD